MRPPAKWWIAIPITIAIVLFLWERFSSRPHPNGNQAAAISLEHHRNGLQRGLQRIPVSVQPVMLRTLHRSLSAMGTVTARRTVLVRTLVDGQLIRVYFREGQLVHAGELLARIDPRPYEAALANVKAQMARDRALLQDALIDRNRYRTLWSQDSIPRQQVDTQEALVRQMQGTIDADKAQIRIARLNLGYSQIRAPVAGKVGLRLVDPGNIVHASDTTGLVVLTEIRPIDIVFPIPQDDLAPVLERMRAGRSLRVDAYDQSGKKRLARGRLTATDSQIDPTTGTIKLKAAFPNANRILFPNQFVNVRLRLETIRDTPSIPLAAIQQGAPGRYVYQVDPDGTVALRTPRFGVSDGKWIQVVDGLVPGDEVVIDGIDRLRNGDKVEIVRK